MTHCGREAGPDGPHHSYCATLSADHGAVVRLRDFVGLWVQPFVRDAQTRTTIATATAELLENAIRHGGPGAIDFEIEAHSSRICIRVTNPIDRDTEHVGALAERVRLINTITADGAYQIQIELAASGAPSGLGLARIAHEGCKLACTLRPFDRQVAVEALFAL